MKKGIIFSVDATYGMLAVFFVLSLLSFHYIEAGNTPDFAKKTGPETNDGAIIGFYTAKDGVGLGLDEPGSLNGQEFYECTRHRIFNLQPGSGQSDFNSPKEYCRVIEWKKE
ncbi:MAG: hypothetical protein HY392_04150 [Candidatus Diapherotrites archaeon]|nr:hypothetical protein [Candidatus Diapherotrites archaeon]